MKWIGQHIYDLASRFRNDVFLEDISTGTIASGAHLGLDSNNKIVKAVDGGGDLTSIVAGTGLSGTSLTGPIPTLNVDASIPSITTLAGLTSFGAAGATTDIVAGDVTMYNAVNDGNPTISLGSSATNRLEMVSTYNSGAQTLDSVSFNSYTTSSGSNDGRYFWRVDENQLMALLDAGLTVYGTVFAGADGASITSQNTTASSATEGGKLVLRCDDGAAMGDDHRLGVVEFSGAEDASNNRQTGASIQAMCDAAWSASENGTRLEFYTMDGNASSELSLTLDSDLLATFAGGVTVTGTITGDVTGDLTGQADTVATIAGLAPNTATTQATQAAITTLAGVTSLGVASATTDIAAGDLTMYNAVNDGNPTISLGSSSTNRFEIKTAYNSGAQTLDEVYFNTYTTSTSSNDGRYIWQVDEVELAKLLDAGLVVFGNINTNDAASSITCQSTTASSSTAGGTLAVVSNDGAAMGDDHRLGVIEFKGAEDASNTLVTGASIQAMCDAAWSASENGTRLEFYTMDGNASSELSLTLDSDLLATFAGAVTVTGALTGTLATVSQPNITGVGTIGTGVWRGDAIASVYLDGDTAHLTGAQTFTGTKTLNSFKGTGGATVTNILDEDAMGSDSATALATQQSIKAYADTKVSSAAQRQLTFHNYKADQDTTKTYVSLADADSESTGTSNNDMPLTAPVAGKLLKVFLRSNKNLGGHTLTWRLETQAGVNYSTGPSVVGTQSGAGCQNTTMTTYDFTSSLDSGDNLVDAGDAIYLSLQSDTDFGNNVIYYITCMWEWDLS